MVQRNLEALLKSRLWAKLLFALFLGVVFGYVLVNLEREIGGTWSLIVADWIALPGSIYLAAIQMVIVPLVLCSIILALSSINQETKARKVGTTSLIFVLVSTAFAAFVGIGVTDFFNPGETIRKTLNIQSSITPYQQEHFRITPDTVLRFIPTNPLESILKADLLEILIISFIFGIVMSQMESLQVRPLQQFLKGVQALCLQVITLAMRLAPFAVFGLMLRAVVHSGMTVLTGMIGYLLCTFLGFFIMIICYLAWVSLIAKISPLEFLRRTREALLLAFSLSSSAATMPTTLKVAREELNVEDEISQLVIPLGTTINMAGSAIWQTSATIFLAQVFGAEVSWSQFLLIAMLTVGSSIGTPGVPGAGLGVLSSTLKSVGVPSTGIPLILGVDRLVDMGCTVVNVMGDLVMCLTSKWALRDK
ncbi:MAG: dicarboxylate/amino acid:cation symporter [Bdellovibrionales bacterium]|nr:dicarboxylate/amino acid:cation symporter [Bdellovibrionales bacterium]